MIIECIAHAEFLIELADGYRIVTDPYNAEIGYPVHDIRADAVLVSHGHGDHSAVENVKGWTVKIDKPGSYTLSQGVTVEAIPCFHDDARGAKRGNNLIFVLKAEGLTVAHLGDLGHLPDAELAAKVGPVDILMIPVGGFFTIDADTAVDVVRLLKARVILPMHYRTEVNDGQLAHRAGGRLRPGDGRKGRDPAPPAGDRRGPVHAAPPRRAGTAPRGINLYPGTAQAVIPSG